MAEFGLSENFVTFDWIIFSVAKRNTSVWSTGS